MLSKIRRRPQVAPQYPYVSLPSPITCVKIIRSTYQMIEGFTRVPVAPDGNCFYTATGFFCDLNAAEMRRLVISYFIFKKAEYSIFFESEVHFMKAVRANSLPRVWNSEICDIAPHAVAHALCREVIIHNYNGKNITRVHTSLAYTHSLSAYTFTLSHTHPNE